MNMRCQRALGETVMKTRIIKIGNSQGVRLPKLLLAQVDLGEEVEVEVQQNQIVIRPAQGPRHGWDAQFRDVFNRFGLEVATLWSNVSSPKAGRLAVKRSGFKLNGENPLTATLDSQGTVGVKML